MDSRRKTSLNWVTQVYYCRYNPHKTNHLASKMVGGEGPCMFLACRHIKPNGVRCESPALRGHSFCYFHAKLHSTTRIGVSDDFRLPLPEDAAGGWPRSRMTLPNHDDGAPRSLAFSDRGWKQNSSTPSTTPAFGNPLNPKPEKPSRLCRIFLRIHYTGLIVSWPAGRRGGAPARFFAAVS